jgi:signal transduction histidine kinase/CheY-like chemotaxis protein
MSRSASGEYVAITAADNSDSSLPLIYDNALLIILSKLITAYIIINPAVTPPTITWLNNAARLLFRVNDIPTTTSLTLSQLLRHDAADEQNATNKSMISALIPGQANSATAVWNVNDEKIGMISAQYTAQVMQEQTILILLQAWSMTPASSSKPATSVAVTTRTDNSVVTNLKSDLNIAAHEIKNEVHSIMSCVALIDKWSLSPQQRDTLTDLNHTSNQLYRLTKDWLRASKAEIQNNLETRTVLLQSVIARVLESRAQAAEFANIELTYIIDPHVPSYIDGAVSQIEWVLTNLVANSVKFSREQYNDRTTFNQEAATMLPASMKSADNQRKIVAVTCSLLHTTNESMTLELSVSDEGIGIRAEKQARIFRPFSQAELSIDRTHGGSGMGLYICKRYAHRMGGDLRFDSVFGRGSRFSFTFIVNQPKIVGDAIIDNISSLTSARNNVMQNSSDVDWFHTNSNMLTYCLGYRVALLEQYRDNGHLIDSLVRRMHMECHRPTQDVARQSPSLTSPPPPRIDGHTSSKPLLLSWSDYDIIIVEDDTTILSHYVPAQVALAQGWCLAHRDRDPSIAAAHNTSQPRSEEYQRSTPSSTSSDNKVPVPLLDAQAINLPAPLSPIGTLKRESSPSVEDKKEIDDGKVTVFTDMNEIMIGVNKSDPVAVTPLRVPSERGRLVIFLTNKQHLYNKFNKIVIDHRSSSAPPSHQVRHRRINSTGPVSSRVSASPTQRSLSSSRVNNNDDSYARTTSASPNITRRSILQHTATARAGSLPIVSKTSLSVTLRVIKKPIKLQHLFKIITEHCRAHTTTNPTSSVDAISTFDFTSAFDAGLCLDVSIYHTANSIFDGELASPLSVSLSPPSQTISLQSIESGEFSPALSSQNSSPSVSSTDTAKVTPSAQQQSLTILIADDSFITLKLTSKWLHNLNHSVLQASNGTKAYDMLIEPLSDSSAVFCDVAILDWSMNGLNAAQIATTVRKEYALHGKLSALPVFICLSGHDETEIGDECRRAGIDQLFAKPIPHRDIEVFLANIMPQAKRELATTQIEKIRNSYE